MSDQTEGNDQNQFDEIFNSRKKRGRPRKSNLNSGDKQRSESVVVNEESEIKDEQEQEIVLHIPVHLQDIPFVPKKETVSNIFSKQTKTQSVTSQSPFIISDMSYNSSSDDYEGTSKELVKKIKEQEERIKHLENEINEYKNMLTESINSGMIDKRVTKMNIDFVDCSNGKTMVPEKTNVACWWCTHNFEGQPIFLPDSYTDNHYHVFGCFCSFECAAAYNIDTDDYKVWDRYSLLKKLHNTVYKNKILSIAPPRESLKKFGGPLSIEEFRKTSSKADKNVRFIMPPMVSMVPMIEETNKNTTVFKQFTNDDLVLKRSKPLPTTKSNLYEAMGIRRR